MKIECIAIGDELLDGRVVETNANWLGGQAFERGATLSRVTTVADDVLDIEGALEEAGGQIVVVCGGLGPTSDDVTRDAVARWLKTELVEDGPSKTRLEQRFAKRGITVTANNYRQVLFPRTAEILPTDVGSAAGFCVRLELRTFFFFPGVPSEFRWFFDTYVAPELPGGQATRCQLHFFGRGESALEDDLQGLDALSEAHHVRVGYRATYPLIEIKLAGTPAGVEAVRAFVLDKVGHYNVGEDNETLAARVGRLLNDRDATITTAESCTAGGIAAAITDVSGSSRWFERGFVTYSNDAKTEMLGVRAATLEAYGAVSAPTVCQMAAGARARANADVAVAVSGIAGPGGGTPEKPVGTVHFSVATRSEVWHYRAVFAGRSRDQVRQSAVYTALALVLALLEDKPHRFELDGPYDPTDVLSGAQPDPV
ncbi:MAG: CinA family nicotinamide mononucleotide deamidase-related protein [bacterium]